MNRRRFLNQIFGFFAVVSLPLLPRPTSASAIEARLVDVFDDEGAAEAIGRAYLAQQGHGQGATSVRALLFEKLGPSLGRDEMTRDEVRDALRARIRQDFADGDCIKLDGWVLSATEVNLCALVALRG